MLRAFVLIGLLLQAIPAPAIPAPVVPAPRSSVVMKPCEPPQRNVLILYYDEVFLIAGRHFGDQRDPAGAGEPGLFVHSKEKNRWAQILAISTAGAKLGRSWSDDPQVQRKLRAAPVGWDFTTFATRPYIDQPLHTSGSIAFPDRISYDPVSGQYELRFFSSWGAPTAETVLYILRSDLVEAFAKR
jgi:hypothetical protein